MGPLPVFRRVVGDGLVGQAGAEELDFQREFLSDDVEFGLGVVDGRGRFGDVVLGDFELLFEGNVRCQQHRLGDDVAFGRFGDVLELLLEALELGFGTDQIALGDGELILVELVERDGPLVDVQADPAVVPTADDVTREGAPIASLADDDRDLRAIAVLRTAYRVYRILLHDCLLRPTRV